MTKTRFGRSASARAARGSARANLKISDPIQLPYFLLNSRHAAGLPALADRAVKVPASPIGGSYIVANVRVPKSVQLVGCNGTTATIHVPAGPTIPFALQLNTNTTLRNLHFRGSVADTRNPDVDGMVNVGPVSGVVIEGCSFMHDGPLTVPWYTAGRAGIFLNGSTAFVIRSNQFGWLARAMRLWFSSGGNITGNTIQNIVGDGIQFWCNSFAGANESQWYQKQACTDLRFEGNHVTNASTGAGIWGLGVVGVTFEGNVVDGVGDLGIDCEWCTNVTITSNTLRNCHNAGISLMISNRHATISNNTIEVYSPGYKGATPGGMHGGMGIWLSPTNHHAFPGDTGHSDITISDNTVLVRANTPDPPSHSNTVVVPDRKGIEVASGNRIFIRGNTLLNGSVSSIDPYNVPTPPLGDTAS